MGAETALHHRAADVVRPEELDGTRVAVVLGAQVHADGRPSRFLRGRLETARRLHAGGRVASLLVSGDGRAASHAEPTAMRDWLVAAGVPAADVTVDPHGYDTYDTCWRAVHVYGHRQVVMVSQTYHLPRALLTCRLLGLDAVGVGDESVRGTRVWRQGALRERFALLKLARDVLTRRRPSTDR
ncbi:protein SanA, affects membrane permeability for vancomycin [Auraticoccus monumenti]|uniref:Protein SanA, affects membrane permeability for vancomycin n=1 Tax=Auraticoccus monumenti TaxID=675864 RepID=A0A1G6VGN9_9ACTN|nr:protein SanA, affects membrane permeability for vancomycin [Auraticoccus monumenti]